MNSSTCFGTTRTASSSPERSAPGSSRFSAASASWFNTALTPDNYLVSPQLSLSENEQLSYFVASQDPYFLEEKYGVYLSTTGNNEEDFTDFNAFRTESTWSRRLGSGRRPI